MSRRGESVPGHRRLRVGEEVRHALAAVVERGALRDPRLAGVAVTVTEVRMSADLRRATVFVVPLGGTATADVVEALAKARPFLRRQVAGAVKLKYVPELVFRADETFDEAGRIDALLRQPSVVRDLDGSGEDGDGT